MIKYKIKPIDKAIRAIKKAVRVAKKYGRLITHQILTIKMGVAFLIGCIFSNYYTSHRCLGVLAVVTFLVLFTTVICSLFVIKEKQHNKTTK